MRRSSEHPPQRERASYADPAGSARESGDVVASSIAVAGVDASSHADGSAARLMDALPIPLLAITDVGHIRRANPAADRLFGFAHGDLDGRRIDTLIRAFPKNRLRPAAATPAASGTSPPSRVVGVRADGEEIPLEMEIGLLPDGEEHLGLVSLRDLRVEQRVETALLDAEIAAERAGRIRSRLLASVSHDLRQPLQVVGLLLGMVARNAADPSTRDIVARLDGTISEMANYLNNLLRGAGDRHDRIEREISAFEATAPAKRAAETVSGRADTSRSGLRVVPSRAMIRSDPTLIERMIAILLAHAVRLAGGERVLSGCRRRGGRVRIEVWDPGPGATEAPPRSAERGGDPDLDIRVLRRSAELLGCEIEWRRPTRLGTVSAVIVPAAPVETGASRGGDPAPSEETRGPTVLLVEDHPIQLQMIQALLELAGYRVVPTVGGISALAAIEGVSGIRPDVIVGDLDLSTESMTGLDVVRRIRARIGAAVPALILTGWAQTTATDQTPGVVFLTKPVGTEDLLQVVEALARIGSPQWTNRKKAVPAAAPVPVVDADAEIAIVEDEPATREALRLTLASAGYRVAAYASAEAYLADVPSAALRCLLVDVVLPGMGGFELQDRLKHLRPDLPVVFVTGRADLRLATDAMRAGAADYLCKPVETDALLASVARVVRESDRRGHRRADKGDFDLRLATLTERERQVMVRMQTGTPTKLIAADLGISARTAEHHRQNVMKKMAARSLADLVRMLA